MDEAKPLRRGRDLQRSLTLLRVFLLASALICAGAGVVLGSILSRSLKSEALNAEATALARYVDGVEHHLLVRHGRVHIPWKRDGQLAQSVLRQRDIATVKVWRRDGILAWTNTVSRSSTATLVANRDRHLIDHRFPLDDELGEAIHESRSQSSSAPAGRVRTRSSATSSASSSSSRSIRRSRTRPGTRSAPTRSMRIPRPSAD